MSRVSRLRAGLFSSATARIVSIVKLYELPVELPDSVVIGRLSHYEKVLTPPARGGYFQWCATARMINKPIPSQAFITGEFVRIWYPSQPKTCRKCGAERHLAAACFLQRCFNREQPVIDPKNVRYRLFAEFASRKHTQLCAVLSFITARIFLRWK